MEVVGPTNIDLKNIPPIRSDPSKRMLTEATQVSYKSGSDPWGDPTHVYPWGEVHQR